MAAACGSPATPGRARPFSSPCPPQSRRTHVVWSCAQMVANLRSLYRLSHTISASQSTVRNGTYAQIVYSPTGAKIEIMNGQSVTEIIVPLPGGALAANSSAGPRLYHHPDHLGSARFVSTSSRTMYYDGAFAPFGEPYAQSGTTDLSFTGMNQDTVAGLYDFPAREYGIQGRWPSPHPPGLAAVDPTNPQSWHRSPYVLNNPLH